jgi:16S rRNA pseudouridine516 synthase
MRIDKVLSNLKYGTRNEIKEAIKNKLVVVNDVLCKSPKEQVDPTKDTILFDGNLVYYKEQITLMMNKPQGVISATKDGLHKTVIDLLQSPYDRFDFSIAGRLDIDTEGLLILSTDGDLIHSLITPKKNVFKTYYVEVERPMDAKDLLQDMLIKDGKNNDYVPMKRRVEQITDTSFHLSICEGKFHQVKRMVAYCNNKVTYLKRIAIGDIVLDETLGLGDYKEV